MFDAKVSPICKKNLNAWRDDIGVDTNKKKNAKQQSNVLFFFK